MKPNKKKHLLTTAFIFIVVLNTKCQETIEPEHIIRRKDTAFIREDYHLARIRDSRSTGQLAEIWVGNWDTTKLAVKVYRNNKLMSLTFYEDGQHEGPIILCNTNGTVWLRGKYVNGQREGTFKYFDSEGNLATTEEFKTGAVQVVEEPPIKSHPKSEKEQLMEKIDWAQKTPSYEGGGYLPLIKAFNAYNHKNWEHYFAGAYIHEKELKAIEQIGYFETEKISFTRKFQAQPYDTKQKKSFELFMYVRSDKLKYEKIDIRDVGMIYIHPGKDQEKH